jgi:hypothetical protein
MFQLHKLMHYVCVQDFADALLQSPMPLIPSPAIYIDVQVSETANEISRFIWHLILHVYLSELVHLISCRIFLHSCKF